jgi:hypothetical protein
MIEENLNKFLAYPKYSTPQLLLESRNPNDKINEKDHPQQIIAVVSPKIVVAGGAGRHVLTTIHWREFFDNAP